MADPIRHRSPLVGWADEIPGTIGTIGVATTGIVATTGDAGHLGGIGIGIGIGIVATVTWAC